MAGWIQVVVGIAAVITALGIIFTKVIRPGARFVAVSEEVVPVMLEFTRIFKNTPGAFAILLEMAKEFKNNSGVTLRDRVEDVAAYAIKANKNVEELREEVREEIRSSVDELSAKIDECLQKKDDT